jgi:hypothetical protein
MSPASYRAAPPRAVALQTKDYSPLQTHFIHPPLTKIQSPDQHKPQNLRRPTKMPAHPPTHPHPHQHEISPHTYATFTHQHHSGSPHTYATFTHQHYSGSPSTDATFTHQAGGPGASPWWGIQGGEALPWPGVWGETPRTDAKEARSFASFQRINWPLTSVAGTGFEPATSGL